MKRSMKRRFATSAFLSGALFLGACGQPTEEAAPAEPAAEPANVVAEPEPAEIAEAPSRDLGGREFVVANWWANYDTDYFEPETAEQEAVLNWRREIEERYNFRMREVNVGGWGEFLELTSTSILAGDPIGDIIHLNPVWFFTLQPQGLFAPVSGFDFTPTAANAWNQQMIETATVGGEQYGFTSGNFTSGGIWFNQRLFQEAGLDPELPFDLVASGEWTWDKFLELAHTLTRDTDNDGIPDTYGLVTFSNDILGRAIHSNQAAYVGRDENGLLYNATNTPEFLEALTFVSNLYNEGVMMPQPEGSEWDWFISAFDSGQAAMRTAGHYAATSINENLEDPWGHVPFPKGPRADTHYSFGYLNISVIPSTHSQDEVDDLLFVWELWNRTPEAFQGEDVWMSSAFAIHDNERSVTESIANYLRVPSLQRFPFNIAVPGLEIGDIAWSMWGEDVDPAQLVESIQARWDSIIGEANGFEATYIPEDVEEE